MIVAFGFTGVSTALTVMSDIEVLDIITWSWTSVYTPSPGYNTGGIGGKPNGIGGNDKSGNSNGPSSPSIAIVAGAVTGGLVMFILILIAFYLLSNYHQKQRNQTKNDDEEENKDDDDDCSETSSSYTISQQQNQLSRSPLPSSASTCVSPQQQQHYIHYNNNHIHNNHNNHNHNNKNQEMLEIKFRDPPSSTEPFEYYQNSSRRPSNQVPHPLQINTTNLPTRSDTIGTSTTANSSVLLVPSPWTPIQTKPYKEQQDDITIPSPSSTTTFGFDFNNASSSSNSSDWIIRRAASTPTQHYYNQPMQSIASNISKPDDKFYPPNQLRRAATVCELTNKLSSSSMVTLKNTAKRHSLGDEEQQQQQQNPDDDDDDDALFDRQEFILQSDEVAKVEDVVTIL